VRVFKTKWFGRFARKERISDRHLAAAVREVERGLHDGDLGGNLVKKRLARQGEGKRGGYRTILVYRRSDRAIFVYGFAKSDQANLSPVELREYQKLARIYMRFSEADLAKAVKGDELQEIKNDAEEIS